MKKWVIARPINGISINGDEYAVNDDSKFVCFDTEQEAKGVSRYTDSWTGYVC